MRDEVDYLILPLQRLTAFDVPAKLLGYTVDGVAILPLFACLHWCIDPYKCMAGIWLVPLSEVLNGCIKWLVRRPRPAWVDPRVRLLAWSEEFSFPSSHAQMSAAVCHFFVRASSHPDAQSVTPAWLAYSFVTAVALSRVHVGVHYPSDVAIGAALGLASSEAYCHMLPSLLSLLLRSSTVAARLAILASPGLAAALALYLSYRRVQSTASSDRSKLAAWAANACRGKFASRELDPRGTPLGLYTGMLGVLAGLAVGYALVHGKPASLPTTTAAAIARGVLGNIGLIGLFEGIAALTPRRPLALYTTLRFLKYMMVPLYILLLAPPLFARLGI